MDSQPKWMTWTGWVISVLPVFGLLMSAAMKFIQPEAVTKEFPKFEYPDGILVPLGIVELIATVLYVIPQTSVLGAIVLTGYLGGATATHVRISDDFTAPIVMGVLIWLGLVLREPRLRAILPWRTSPQPPLISKQ